MLKWRFICSTSLCSMVCMANSIGAWCGLALVRCAASASLCCFDSSCFLTLSSFIELHPLTNWFLCSFLLKRRHHSQNIMLLSWLCLSHVRPSVQLLLNHLFWREVLSDRRSYTHLLSDLRCRQQRRLRQSERSSQTQTAPNSSCCVITCPIGHAPPPSQPGTLMIIKNGARKREFSR